MLPSFPPLFLLSLLPLAPAEHVASFPNMHLIRVQDLYCGALSILDQSEKV
jgi:hypothetical protein